MRKLLIFCFFLPLMAWGQSSLPPCPEYGVKNNCFGTDQYGADRYRGEFSSGRPHGSGILIRGDGSRYVGHWRLGQRDGRGVEIAPDGMILATGLWFQGELKSTFNIDLASFQFFDNKSANANRSTQVTTTSPVHSSATVQPEAQKLGPCSGSYWNRCEGSFVYEDGSRYSGEWVANRPHGKGTLVLSSGGTQSGVWEWGEFKSSIRDFKYQILDQSRIASGLQSTASQDTNRFPLKGPRELLNAALESPALRNLPWKDRLDRVVQSELRQWLSPASVLDEVPAPSYPAALSLKQESWETNKEFEDRVEKARTERRQTIDRLQAEYKSKVDERNRRVAEFNKQQQERQAQLPQKRRELIQLGISVLNPAVSLADPAFDQQSGALTVAAQVDGLGKQTFAFKDTPQAFRKSALTEPKSMKAKPEFQVSDAGEITLQGITVEAGGVSARGVPSAGITPSVQLATVNLPQSTAPALVQQSAITVDRNQVEQILYREENDLLRKRLEDQRKQQEQAVANAEAKAAAEIARIRAEAEALKKQQPVPVLNYAAVQDAHALVIGNSAYPGSNRLANPTNDAKAMTAKLRSLGFKVTEIANATREQMVRGLSEFSKTASRADLTLLFYAGHGVQIAGTNYMIPIDMSLNDASQATLQAVSLNSVVEHYLTGKTKLVFLDACRDNPLMASVGRGITKGLAPINVSQGTLIAYATKDGQTADDGVGSKNSPFTSALLDHLGDPDDIAVVLRTVRAKVMERTNNRQQPWEYGSLTGGALVLSAIKR